MNAPADGSPTGSAEGSKNLGENGGRVCGVNPSPAKEGRRKERREGGEGWGRGGEGKPTADESREEGEWRMGPPTKRGTMKESDEKKHQKRERKKRDALSLIFRCSDVTSSLAPLWA